MITNTDKNTASNSQPTSRWPKFLVVCAVLVPMVAAYIIYETGYGIPTSTINKGVILNPPVQIDDMGFTTVEGKSVHFADQARKWRLVVPAFGGCDAGCKSALYTTRQVQTRLNENFARVERIVIADEVDQNTQAFLDAEHVQVKVFLTSLENWQARLNSTNYQAGGYLMMDQNGFLMMFYDQQQSGNDLLADLKRMLKFTREQ